MNFIFIGFLIAGGLIDLRNRKIPNKITFPLIIISLGYHIFFGNYLFSLTGLAFSFFLGIVLFITNGIGGGDVKLLIAIGIYKGISEFINIFFISALIVLLWSFGFFCKNSISNKSNKNTGIPFGLCLVLAFLYVTYFDVNLFNMFS